MAKVTITIEDKPGNRVEVKLDPTAETLLKKVASHGQTSLTSAEGYALFAANRLREESKRQGGSLIVPVYRVKKP
jgi:hypothetical protein